MANGCSETTASRKMIVRPASRMLSAISFGVFCRLAPSTSAIMRSRKVSPGFEVMRTTIQSESTRVPPVTAERSPPLSRITGADSPVIADSSTEATPSTTSPSPGIKSPASTSTRSPLRSFGAATSSNGVVPGDDLAVRSGEALGQRLVACAAQGIGLRLAAPLRHRLGEVGEEDREPQPERDRRGRRPRSLASAGVDEGANPLDRRDDAADLDDEHDRVARLDAWIELLERVHDRAAR